MSNEDGWRIGIEGALSAHFFQPDGTSQPGTDWSVGLQYGAREKQYVTVRSYLSPDMTRRAQKDTGYQAHTVMGYVSSLLEQGWTPDQGERLEIIIQNPTGEPAEQKSWWKVW